MRFMTLSICDTMAPVRVKAALIFGLVWAETPGPTKSQPYHKPI